MFSKFLKCISGLAVAFCCAGASAETWYVEPNGSDSNSGINDWSNAFQTIAKGIAVAGDGDLVLVSNGTYNASISLAKAVRVQALSTNPADTVVDMQAAGACLTLNHPDALCAGFTLTNGRAVYGAGVKINAQGGTLSNCVISGNVSSGGGGGGGIYMQTGLVVNCVIAGNLTTNTGGAGAGVRMLEGELRNCIISNNVATNSPTGHIHGGGIHLTTGRVIDCEIVNNRSINALFDPPIGGFGGGMSIVSESTGTLVSGCVFRANSSYSGGGAIYLGGTSNVISDNLFENNICFANGGALSIAGKTNYLDRCLISGNNAGGGGGGAVVNDGITLIMRNCLVNNNVSSGSYGGGGLLLLGTIGEAGYISGCTIVSNVVKINPGGGLRLVKNNTPIYNTIVYSNLALANPATDEISHGVAASSNDYSNCCVSKPQLPPAAGNITTAPVFEDFHAANFRLVHGSPGINAGIYQDWMDDACDLDGRKRLDRFTGLPDMGCYEYIFPGVMFLLR